MAIKKRYNYIDAIKALAILMVCTYHFWNGGNNLYAPDMTFGTMVRRFLMGFLSPCVPLFMMANGALLLNRPMDVEKHYKGLLLILLQFLFWRSLTLLVLGCMDAVAFSDFSVARWINHFLLLMPINDAYEGHFWFIPMFCCIYLLAPLFRKAFDPDAGKDSAILFLVLGAALFCWNFLLPDFNIWKRIIPYAKDLDPGYLNSLNPLSFYPGIMAVYFLLGGFLHRYREKTASIPVFLCLAMIAFGGILTYGAWLIMSSTQETLFDNIFSGYGSSATLLSSAAIFILFQKWEAPLSTRKWAVTVVNAIGRNTLTVYYLHWIIGMALLPRLSLPVGLVSNALRAIGLVIIGTLAGELLRRIPILRKLVH